MRTVRLTLYIGAPILFVLLPSSFFEVGQGICLFKNLFGHECPGCGMTRALRAAVHGDIAAAIRYNCSVVVVFPLVCVALAKAILQECTGIAGTDTTRIMRRLCSRIRFRHPDPYESVNRKGG